MGMHVRSDFVALIGMFLIGESRDVETCEGQGEILQEYGLWFLRLHRDEVLTKKMSQKC